MLLGLLWCNVGIAKIIDFKCSKYLTRTYDDLENTAYIDDYDSRWIIHMELDTSRKTITRFRDQIPEEEWEKKIYKIDNITENAYYSGDSLLATTEHFVTFNRYTGILIYTIRYYSGSKTHSFSCEPTKQIY